MVVSCSSDKAHSQVSLPVNETRIRSSLDVLGWTSMRLAEQQARCVLAHCRKRKQNFLTSSEVGSGSLSRVVKLTGCRISSIVELRVRRYSE